MPSPEVCAGGGSLHRFDSFAFQREGLKVTGAAGSLYKGTRDGHVECLVITAESLVWEVAPPVEADRQLFEIYRKQHREEMTFAPDYVSVACDPVSCDEILSSTFQGLRDITSGSLPEQGLGRILERTRQREDGASFESRPVYEPEDRRYTVSILKEHSERSARLEYDNREPKEVAIAITGFGVWTWHSELTRAGGASAENLERRLDAALRDYDLESLAGTVELALAGKELLAGDLVFGLKARRKLTRIPFSFAQLSGPRSARKEAKAPRMTISSIRDGEGRDLSWIRTGPESGVVTLLEPVPAGAPITLRMSYENRDGIIKVSSSYSYVDRDGWLPFVRYGDMIPDFNLTLKVPARYRTLGPGRKASESTVGDVSITRWVADSPAVFPTAIYGIYIDDKPGVKATRKDGSAIPIEMHFDRDMAVAGNVAPRARRAAGDQAANALNLYRELFGVDYPFSKLDLVNAPQGFSGQSPDSIVYLGNPTFLSEGVLGEMGGASVTRFTGSLVAHEVAHQWFGSLIAPANAASYWFVESLAEYSAALYLEAAQGRAAYQDQVGAWRLEAVMEESWRSLQDGAGIYRKGPYLFHMLRLAFGDEAFFTFLKMLAGELKGKEIVTRDIEKVAATAFGIDMAWFFDQWVRGVGIPELSFTSRIVESADGSLKLEGRIDQRIMVTTRATTKAAAREVLPGRIFQAVSTVTLIGKSGREYSKKVFLDGPSVSFEVPLPEKPKEIIFNRKGDILAYDIIVSQQKAGEDK